MSEWKESSLDNYIDFKNGKKRPENDGIYPVYGGNGILGYANSFNSDEGTLIIGRVGAYCGSVYYERGKCWVSDNAIIAYGKKNADNVFLFYLLTHLNLNRRHIGTSQPLMTQEILKSIVYTFPSLSEQKAIAAVLSALDDKIEINNQINQKLEEIARAVFKSWFVDFEPFQDGEFEDSELGMIPKGWRVESLDGIANFLNGLPMQKYRPETDESLPVIKIKELNQGKTDDNSDRATVNLPSEYIIDNGDVIFSWSGTLVVKLWLGGKGGLNQHLFKVTSDKYHKWFYYYWTKIHLDKFVAIAKSKATTMGHIQRKHLNDAKVLIPSKSDYLLLDRLLNPIVEQMINLGIQNQHFCELRDSLLPKLMSGEIEMGEGI